jgi:GNAT superfamily N-acetyltransferase
MAHNFSDVKAGVTSSNDVVIRRVAVADVSRLNDLTDQLGYHVAPESTGKYLATILEREDHIVFVAEIGGEIMGWVHAYIRPLLTSPINIELGGLVVDERCRSQGVGERLMDRVESWALENGVEEVFVRSRLDRERAHKFYQRIGYKTLKTSYTFHKKLR